MSSLRTTLTSATVRQLRLMALLDGAEQVGMTPLPLGPLHVIAYFTDALAPVWHLPIIDGQILKRIRPYYPSLQSDLDSLVGRGVVTVVDVSFAPDGRHWRLDAKYSLNREFADRILAVAERFSLRAEELKFVREVVFATSGLGFDGLGGVGRVDAAYSDPLVDVGGVIDLARDPGEGDNLTAQVALRFGQLLGDESGATTAEMLNLYVRRLYSRLRVA